MDETVYLPVHKILSNPMLFALVSELLGIPPSVMADGFYDLVDESVKSNLSVEGLVMFAREDEDLLVVFENRMALRMEKREEGVFQSRKEVETSFEVNTWINSVLRQHLPPDWKDDFGLVEVPLPSNNFLLDLSLEQFVGEVYKLSDPDQKKKFSLTVTGEETYDVKLG
jgi:hypothetical protein